MNNLNILRDSKTITIFSPATHQEPKVLKKALQGDSWLNSIYGAKLSLLAPFLFRDSFMSFAGTDAQRIDELQRLLAQPAFLLAASGGYGCIKLLEGISLTGQERGVICGFSDLTAIINYLAWHTKMNCFHGPMLLYPAKIKIGGYLEKSWRDFFIENLSSTVFSFGGEMFFGNRLSGKLVGGNLATICSLFGTDYAIPLSGNLLFLEDIDEPVYRIDRMLTQLSMQAGFSELRGVIFGNFSACSPRTGTHDPTLSELLHFFAKKWQKPVIFHAPIGHIADFPLLPIGGWAEFNMEKDNIISGLVSVS